MHAGHDHMVPSSAASVSGGGREGCYQLDRPHGPEWSTDSLRPEAPQDRPLAHEAPPGSAGMRAARAVASGVLGLRFRAPDLGYVSQ
jgi:hypothetical protein